MKKEIPNKWQNLTKKLAHPYEYFKSIAVYKKPVENLKKEDFFHKLKSECPSDAGMKSTKEIIKLFDFKNGEELTKLYLKSDISLLADVFEKFIKRLFEDY